MKVLVLGGAGYIGAVLCDYLKEKGDRVTIFDNLLYEQDSNLKSNFSFIHGDICSNHDLVPAISSHDAVVNLAAISNDPASDLSPNLTLQINLRANKLIAAVCKAAKKRIVFASSCSVYGFADKVVFSERSRLNPITLYAHTKMLSEKLYLDGDQNSVILRLATVYGHSPKPRLDLVVNTMIGTSFFEGKIIVNGGEQWRPVVHVLDVARSIYIALHAKKPKHKIYNVGSNDQNWKISKLGEAIAKEIKGVEFVHLKDNVDMRSYLVDFSRLEKEFRFKCMYGLKDAVRELYKSFGAGDIKNMNADIYYRVKYLKKNIKSLSYRKRTLIHSIVL